MGGMRKWRRHTLEFKRQVVERMKTCGNVGALAQELDLQRKLLYTWKWQLEGHPEPRHANLAITAEERKEKHWREEVAKLQAALAQRTVENDFFASALLKIAEHRQPGSTRGAVASTKPSGRGRKSKAQ